MVMQRIMEPFTWGSGGRKLTPEQVAREREMAAALAGSIGDTSPVGHWTAGMARMVDALGSRMREGRADRAEQEGIEGASDWARSRLAQALTGGGGAGQSTAPALSGGGESFSENDIYNTFMGAVGQQIDNPNALAAIAATGRAESGFSPQNAFGTWSDPSQSGQPGTSGGIMSWRNDRLNNLAAFAQAQGDDPSRPSPATQAAFFLQEDPNLVAALQGAGSAEEAMSLMNNAWRFAGYDQPGGEAARRLDYANEFLPGFASAGDGQQVTVSTMGGSGIAEALAGGGAPSGDNSGLVEALMEGMSNPWVRQQYGGVLEALMGQQMQGMDPMYQAQLENMQLKNEGLRNPRPDYPTSFQEWMLGQQHPEYGATLGGDSAAVDRINRLTGNLMATGDFLDPQEARNMASGIVDGRFKLDRHPVSGVAQIVDMATQRVLYGPGAGADQQGDMGQVDPLGTMPAGTDFSEATGAAGLAANLANTASEILGLGLIAPENERATQALTNLQNRTMIDLTDAVPGRPSNYLLEMFERLTVSPNSPFQGQGRARERLMQTRALVDQGIQENNDIIRNADLHSPQTVGQARQSMQRLMTLRRDYDSVIEAFGSGAQRDGGQGTTSGGVQWRIVE